MASANSLPLRRLAISRPLTLAAILATLLVLLAIAALIARHWLRASVRDSLPQISGTLHTSGLSAPVTVSRNPQGVPSLHARSLPDLFFAQGFTTAQDRLFQMDTLRRHAAGTLAEILGSSLLPHDRAQRILGLAAAADSILAQLPPDQRLAFQRYADGVNASLALQSAHLPVEFRILAYTPAPWTPHDCVLVSLILFQELTDTFPRKLARESLTAHFDPSASPELRAQLLADLYPVGSWRDHPPSQPTTDVTTPPDALPDIPLDPSQTHLRSPPKPVISTPAPNQAVISTEDFATRNRSGETPSFQRPQPPLQPPTPFTNPTNLLALQHLLSPLAPDTRAGSNNWAVAGAHTASGLPLLSNDMHLSLTAPGIWYTVNLVTPDLHVAGVSLPGVPFVIVGHNDYVAWGFTNLGADVQDLYLEHLRNNSTEFLTPSGQWLPVHHRSELIRVRGAHDLTLDVRSTTHGGVETPLVTPLLAGEQRPIALRWSLDDTSAASFPFNRAATATSGADLAQVFSAYTGPAQNLVWADDQNHIGYHAIGRIPIRGSLSAPAPLSPIPTDSTAPNAAAHEWVGFIPYAQLPSTVDPVGGILVTANSRITPDTYPFPIALDWVSPYRTERLFHLLTGRSGLQPVDMLPIQTDITSESDKLIAHRLAYAIDHSATPSTQLRQAADLLRNWNGELRPDTPAPLISAAARHALWTLLLTPKLPNPAVISTGAQRSGETPSSKQPPLSSPARTPTHTPRLSDLLSLYQWFEQDFAQEQIIAHQPSRWLPSNFASWDDLLAAAVAQGLVNLHAPHNLARLRYGRIDLATGAPDPSNFELPLFAQAAILRLLLGLPTGSGPLALPGNGRTVWQSGQNFGPSERFTADLAHPDASTLVLPMGESENPLSPFFRDQLPAWFGASTFPLPFNSTPPFTTLTLEP